MNQRLERILSDSKQLENSKRRLLEQLSKEPPLTEEQLSRTESEKARDIHFTQQLKEAHTSFKFLQTVMADSLRSIEGNLAQRKNSRVQEETIRSLKERLKVSEAENSGLRAQLESKERQIGSMAEQMGKEKHSFQKKLQHARSKFKDGLEALTIRLKTLKREHLTLRNFVEGELKTLGLKELISQILNRNESVKKAVQTLQASQLLQLKKTEQQSTTFREQVIMCCASVAQYTAVKQPSSIRLSQEFPIFSQELIKYLSVSRLLCESDIVEDHTTRVWVLEQLREELMCDRIASKLVYRFDGDELNKVNFHHYIDGRANLMVIVKLANGNTVGAFTKFPISEHHIERPGCGFLFNATRREAYHSFSESQQAVAGYDPYYIIFGNSEFRLKSLELRFYSNFGISSGAFSTHGHKKIDFMGVQDPETDLESFEVHQILC